MIYSVIILNETKYLDIHIAKEKIFEESIVLCRLEDDFFDDKSYLDILKYFKSKFNSNIYVNANNQEVYTEIVAIIDKFQILDEVDFADYTEVYSRHFIESSNFTVEQIIGKYYSGYCAFDIE